MFVSCVFTDKPTKKGLGGQENKKAKTRIEPMCTGIMESVAPANRRRGSI